MKIRIRYRTLDHVLKDKHRILPNDTAYHFAQFERRSLRGHTVYLVNDLNETQKKGNQ